MIGFDPPTAKRIKEGREEVETWQVSEGEEEGVRKKSRALCPFQYSAFITVILGGQVALCALTAVYKYEVSFWVASHSPQAMACLRDSGMMMDRQVER